MKLLRLLSFALLAQCMLLNGLKAAEPELSDYQKAVKAYVDAAGQELQALQTQVSGALKGADEAKKAAYRGLLGRLEKCEEVYEQLKAAAPKDFDRLKALYEKQRDETLKALAEITVR